MTSERQKAFCPTNFSSQICAYNDQQFSKIIAAPCPTPTHIVASP